MKGDIKIMNIMNSVNSNLKSMLKKILEMQRQFMTRTVELCKKITFPVIFSTAMFIFIFCILRRIIKKCQQRRDVMIGLMIVSIMMLTTGASMILDNKYVADEYVEFPTTVRTSTTPQPPRLTLDEIPRQNSRTSYRTSQEVVVEKIEYEEVYEEDIELEYLVGILWPAPTETTIYNDNTIRMMAKMVWGEARGCDPEEQVLVVWTVLQRYDRGTWGSTLERIITAELQFIGYEPQHPVMQDIYELCRDEMWKWYCGLDAPLLYPFATSAPYYYFNGDGTHNWFREHF